MDDIFLDIVTVNIDTISKYIDLLKENPIRIISLVLDLIIVIYAIYKIFKLAKNSRVMQLIKGIIFFVIITWLSGILNLSITHSILTAFLPSGVIALIVIFQPEVRRALEQLGTNKFTNFFGIEKNLETKTREDIYKIVIAAEEMSKTKTGALIVIQRDISLSDVIATGIEMNSEISPQLLVNIFVPKTPLHDGAVVIRDNKIAASACILPLADGKDISKDLGTRHRAAVGITEISDALVIVVSEETGIISLAEAGKLTRNLTGDELKALLLKKLDRTKNASMIKNIVKKDEIKEEK